MFQIMNQNNMNIENNSIYLGLICCSSGRESHKVTDVLFVHVPHKFGAHCQRLPASSWPNAKRIRFIDQQITYQGRVSYAVHCWYFHVCESYDSKM